VIRAFGVGIVTFKTLNCHVQFIWFGPNVH
jgi:hypothetical protein